MLKNNKVLIRSLVIIPLSSYICHANASDSVASYEESLNQNSVSQSDVSTNNSGPASYDMNQLSIELEKRGWTVSKDENDSLILSPNVTAKETNKKASTEAEQWPQIQLRFSKAGWQAEREADGSLRLTPTLEKTLSSTNKEQSTDSSIAEDNANKSYLEMQQQLQEKGWDVNIDPDGSMILYPPKEASSSKPKPCSGIKSTATVKLPVNTWQEAHDIAKSWLHSNAISKGNHQLHVQPASLGKIRKIINVYIISIVASKTPHTLLHQIAIRNRDGAVIILN